MNRLNRNRKGGTIVLMLMLMTVVFIFVAFAVDVSRIQLAQLKLQTASDLSARAGAEAMSRGVGDISNLNNFEASIRNECDMVMSLNQLFGQPVTFDANAQISFGIADEDVTPKNKGKGKGKGRFKFTKQQHLTLECNSVSVSPDINQFPLVFGSFLSVTDVDLAAMSTSMVQERDIVIVVDKSSSMMDQGAGTVALSLYHPNLMDVENALYGSGDAYHPTGVFAGMGRTTEFTIAGGMVQLTKMQALKLAIFQFRQVIEDTPGNEQLALTGYADFADIAANGPTPPGTVDLEAGLSATVFNAIVTDGICDNYATPNSITEATACPLVDQATNYDQFDFNYLKMRWSSNTNIVDGIEVGADILMDPNRRRPVAQPIMIVLTDGHHNITNAGDAATPLIAAQNAMTAIPELKIYTITFGANSNQQTMIDVANAGKGRHFHADNASNLVEVFTDLASNAGVRIIE